MAVRQCVILAVAALMAGCASSFGSTPGSQRVGTSILHAGGSGPIQHVIIIIQENRTFDNLFHGFPGANFANTGKGKDGKTYTLQSMRLKYTPSDPRHDHPQFLEDYDQGKDDGFDQEIVGFNMNPGSGCSDYINHPTCWRISKNQTLNQLQYHYVQQSDVQEYWTLAQEYALGDDAFASNNGPTYVAHQYLIAGESGHASEVPNEQPWGATATRVRRIRRL
jgi:phospholipase C